MKDEFKTKKQLIQELGALRERHAKLARFAEEQKRTEGSLAQLATFPELNPNPIMEVDFLGSIHYLNRAAQQLFPDLQTLGLQHAWLQGWDSTVALFQKKGKATHVREIQIGDSWYEQSIYCLPERRRIRIYGLDITEHRRMEGELKQAHELLEAVTKGTQVIIAAQDNSFRYTFFNKAYKEEIKRLTGKKIHVGTSMVELFAHMPEQQKIAVREWSRVLRGESTRKTLEFGDPSHYSRVYNVLHTPIRDAQGTVVGAGEVAYDVTEQVLAEEALKKANQKLEILSETASKLLASDEPQKVVNDLCERIMDYLDCQAFFNYLVDEGKQILHLNAYAGIPEESAKEIEWLKYGVAVCGCAARDGCRIIAENIPETLDPRTDLVRSFDIKAYACHPLFVRDRVIGTLSFGTRTRTRFAEDELSLMKTVADQIAVAMEKIQLLEDLRRSREGLEIEVKKRTHDLDERVKELNCLCTTSTLVNEPNTSLEKVFQEIVDLIPSGWQFPEITCTRIVFENQEFRTKNFKETSRKITSNILADGKPVGVVEVYYPEEKPAADEGPFLKEKRTLIHAIATQLEELIERKRAQEAVVAERQRLNSVLEMLPAYLVLLAPDYHVPFANRFFLERFGEAHGRRCFEYLFGRNEPCEVCKSYTVLKTMAPHEWEWTGPDGRNYQVFDFTFTDTDGSTLILEMGIDITGRKQAEKALWTASLYARNLIEASLDPLVTISAEGKIMDVNKATEIVTGIPREYLIGSDFSNYFTDPEKAREGYQQVFREGLVRDYPLAIRHASGKITDVLYNATVYKDEVGGVQGVFAAARDITERKRAEEALRKSEDQLRHLYSQLLAAQENERKRIAQELNDGLQQFLTGIKYKVESFIQEIRKSKVKTETKPLEAVIPIIQESVREIRRIQTNLRPAILDDLGILATISWFCREFETTCPGIQIEKEIDLHENEIPDSLKMAVYRIMQEALTNINKHSRANLARLFLRKTEGRIELSIQDNGQGFDVEEALSKEREKRGMGLGSMNERVEHSGGSLVIESARGKGTVLRATWPV